MERPRNQLSQADMIRAQVLMDQLSKMDSAEDSTHAQQMHATLDELWNGMNKIQREQMMQWAFRR